MLSYKFENVFIESYALNQPSKKITSAEYEEQLSEVYKRLRIPKGTFEKLTGVHSRHLWEDKVAPSQVGTVAALKALEKSSFGKDDIQALFSCSITRDHFEPATGCIIHNDLGLHEDTLALDVSNACLGFMNGLALMANLIETGVIKAGIVVSGENIARPISHCMNHILENDKLSRDDLVKLLPTLTLGSGAVAYVLCNRELATTSHRILGGVSKSATVHHDLCNGNGDYCILQEVGFKPLMTTESTTLINSAAKLGGRVWPQASEVLGWSRDDIDHIICHQVGKQVNKDFYKTMGLDMSKEFTIYREHGNLASAAAPTALVKAIDGRNFQRGDKILVTGFGSGLNSLFMGIEW